MTLLKSIVVCLVLANVGYFLWARGIAKSSEQAPSAPAVTLKLASETAEASHPQTAGGGAAAEAPRADSSEGLLTNVKDRKSVV